MVTDIKDFPPKIQELLKKRGWAWPPTEEMKKEWEEVHKRAAGSLSMDPEISRQIWLEMRGHYWGDEVKKK